LVGGNLFLTRKHFGLVGGNLFLTRKHFGLVGGNLFLTGKHFPLTGKSFQLLVLPILEGGDLSTPPAVPKPPASVLSEEFLKYRPFSIDLSENRKSQADPGSVFLLKAPKDGMSMSALRASDAFI
jgi:hypothetical protein